jgi:hypothetical protein
MKRLISIASVAILVSSAVMSAEPVPTSEFTTTDPKKAKILEDSLREKNPEIDHFKHLCPGLDGYRVIHEGGDSRSWINLEYRGAKTDLASDTMAACRPGHFPVKSNHVVQWRGTRVRGKFVPYAIIYRMLATSDDEKEDRMETLIIIKLDGANSRVVAHVPAAEGNAKAEELADKLCR